MDITAIITATLVVALVGLCIGLFLGVAGKKLAVQIDEKEAAIIEVLPGNNCGACGFPGCSGCAAAIAKKEASITACPVGGDPVAQAIGDIMGEVAGQTEKMVAFVQCSGTCDKTTLDFDYHGVKDCRLMGSLPGGGPKSCKYGCYGFGACEKVCPFDAIHVIDGIAVVDNEKCRACKQCIDTCPRHLIVLKPLKQKQMVRCSSNDKGPQVMKVCKAGCIGCQMCVKACKFDAITFENNLARIDPEKCKGCGACAIKCPKKVITGAPVKKEAPIKKPEEKKTEATTA